MRIGWQGCLIYLSGKWKSLSKEKSIKCTSDFGYVLKSHEKKTFSKFAEYEKP